MRNIFVGLLAGVSIVAMVVAAESQTRRGMTPNSGYCPKGTCNAKGVDGGQVKDVANCSAKNCSGGGSPQKQKK